MPKPWEYDWSECTDPSGLNLLPIVPFIGRQRPPMLESAAVEREGAAPVASAMSQSRVPLRAPAAMSLPAAIVRSIPRSADRDGGNVRPPVSGGAPVPISNWQDMRSSEALSLANGKRRNTSDRHIAGWIEAKILAGRNRDPAEVTDEINRVMAPKGVSIEATDVANVMQYLKKHPAHRGFVEALRSQANSVWERASASAPAAAISAANPLGGLADEVAGLRARLSGGNYTQARNDYERNRQFLAANHPAADLLGNIGGIIESNTFGQGALERGGEEAMAESTARLARMFQAWKEAHPGLYQAINGGVHGALSGYAENNDDRAGGALLSAITGGGAKRYVGGGYDHFKEISGKDPLTPLHLDILSDLLASQLDRTLKPVHERDSPPK